MTQEQRITRTMTEIEAMQKTIDGLYNRMFNNISVNKMGEASAEETDIINRWYEAAKEGLKRDATIMWKICFEQQMI